MTRMFHADALSAPHGFFTREGGVSGGIYAGLQCGYGAKDDPLENVDENRARAAAALGVAPDRLLSVHQHHSADAVHATGPWGDAAPPRADAMVTATPGLALGILTADCAPVLFADAEAGVIGAAHAGWKGALDGVLEASVAAMAALGARRESIIAAVGPCISKENYQVDTAYRGRFTAQNAGNARFFTPDPEPERFRFDLPGYCIARLNAAGVGAAVKTGHCTYADSGLFYSNRRALHRGEPDYGRGLSAILLR